MRETHVKTQAMNTKLTLNIDEAVIEKAKKYARQRHKSLSKVVQQYLEFITDTTTAPMQITESIVELGDTIEVTQSDDELKSRYLSEKYIDASDSR